MNTKIQIVPFPYGKEFAISFVDDTDFSNVENTKPVYDYLFKNRIKGTKTVWPNLQNRNSVCRQENERSRDINLNTGLSLRDPKYLKFIIELQKKGYEIALHNASAGNSYRDEIIKGLEYFKSCLGRYPNINVFHEINIDNLYCGRHKLDFLPLKILEKITDKSDYQGHVKDSPYFWGDIYCDKIKYTRLPFHSIKNINTLKLNPCMPFHDPRRPFVKYWFSSSDGSNCKLFLKLLSKINVHKLKKQNGACIIYTHFANGFTHKKKQKYHINDDLRNLILKLYCHQNAWFPTTSELLDRLLATQKIKLRNSKHCLTLKNFNNFDVYGVTLKVDTGLFLINNNGQRLIPDKKGMIILENLPAHSLVSYECPLKDIQISKNTYSLTRMKMERIKVEILNYIGLAKQNFFR